MLTHFHLSLDHHRHIHSLANPYNLAIQREELVHDNDYHQHKVHLIRLEKNPQKVQQ